MAEPYNVLFSPHNFNSTAIGLAATVHVSAIATNFNITEYFINFQEASNEVLVKPLKLEGGFIDLPTEPGLGVDIDPQVLKSRLFDEGKHVF